MQQQQWLQFNHNTTTGTAAPSLPPPPRVVVRTHHNTGTPPSDLKNAPQHNQMATAKPDVDLLGDIFSSPPPPNPTPPIPAMDDILALSVPVLEPVSVPQVFGRDFCCKSARSALWWMPRGWRVLSEFSAQYARSTWMPPCWTSIPESARLILRKSHPHSTCLLFKVLK